MGIYSKEYFLLKCDKCGQQFEEPDTGFSIFETEPCMRCVGVEYGWRCINGKWYCPECFEKSFFYNYKTRNYEPINNE